MTVVQSTLPVAAGLYWASADHLKVLLVRVGLPLAGILAGTWAVASCVGREEGRFEWKMATQANYTGFEMFRELLFITDAIPERADYEYGGTYLVQVVNPIPRFIWPEKPREDAGLKLARLQGEVASTGEPRLSVAPGMIGEMYWNFGLTGIVLLSLLGGQLLYIWDQFGRLSGDALSFVVFGSGFAVIFALGRSFNMSYFYPFAALLIVISVVRSPRNLVSLADIRNRD